ncbi:hypothetical protein BB558_001250 [Smittium angustum]|uniref:Tr-type G domain-containing protein n=1 Tax=Smittium angustum TaxID=133377 RepID=A0A2U1JBZ5_SMIAN|nr:hypothetical protein BB558_001250 [Smittium angustum]
MDYLPAERERGITINSAAITFGWKDHQINLIDTPGHVDFTIEVERALRVLDGCVTILDGVSGIQAQTLNVWKQSEKYNLAKIIFINKLDRDGASWKRCIAQINKKLRARPLVLQYPIFHDDIEGKGLAIDKYIDVLGIPKFDNLGKMRNLPLFLIDPINLEIIAFNPDKSLKDNSYRVKLINVRSQNDFVWDLAIKMRSAIIEILGELDQDFLDLFFDENVNGDVQLIKNEDLKLAIQRQTFCGNVTPVLLGASYRNFGVQPLLDAVVEYLPSPADRPEVTGYTFHKDKDTRKKLKKQAENEESLENITQSNVPLDPNAPLVAFAFKVVVDLQKGPMIYIKVYSGTLSARSVVINSNNGGVKERVLKLLRMYADIPEEITSIGCGQIGVAIGLKQTRTGDTLLGMNHPSTRFGISSSNSAATSKTGMDPTQDSWGALGDDSFGGSLGGTTAKPVGLYLHGIDIPPPVFFCSVEPESQSDEKHLMTCLSNTLLEDPSLRIYTDNEAGQLLLSGMGELHLEIVRNRLLNELKVKAIFGKMRVSYRESVSFLYETKDFLYDNMVLGKQCKFGISLSVEPIEEPLNPNLDKSLIKLENDNFVTFEKVSIQKVDSNVQNHSKKSKIKHGNNTEHSNITDHHNSTINTILVALSTAIYQGPMLGFPLTKTFIKVSGFQEFGSELSSISAIRLGTRAALKSALEGAGPVLEEPTMRVVINCPDEYVGTVVNDLEKGRRGRIISLDEKDEIETFGTNNDFSGLGVYELLGSKDSDYSASKEITCNVPLSSMVGFSSVLRRLTAGTGAFVMHLDGFSPVDQHTQNEIVKETRGY